MERHMALCWLQWVVAVLCALLSILFAYVYANDHGEYRELSLFFAEWGLLWAFLSAVLASGAKRKKNWARRASILFGSLNIILIPVGTAYGISMFYLSFKPWDAELSVPIAAKPDEALAAFVTRDDLI